MSHPYDSVHSPVTHPCPNCGRDWGAGLACQFCRQVGGLPHGTEISSAARRLGEFLLEWVLVVITAFIGWLVWALIVFKNGQTPAKQVMGMRCVKLRTDQTATWGTMFLREFIARPVIWILSWLTFGIVNFWLVWDANTQQLWDKMVGTIVVNNPPHAVAWTPEQTSPEAESPTPTPV